MLNFKTAAVDIENPSDIVDLLLNCMPLSYVFWKNRKGAYIGANTNQIKLFGKGEHDSFINKTIFEILGNYESAKLIDDIDNKIMQEGVPAILEESVTIPGGEQRIFFSQKQPLKNSKGEVVGLLGFSIDITDRKKMEDELRLAKELAETASKAKTEFLENMRHDIRTPLTGIVGFADILKLECDDSRFKEYADNLVASSHALLDLMDEVLEAVRVSSGEVPRLKKKFNLQKILQHVIELNRAKASQKKLELTLNFDSTIPTYLIGDKIRIHRIILELIANALNFTDSGFIKLSAILAKRNHRELIIKLLVEDTGLGIPKDKQQEIYAQFKRLTPAYQGIYRGSGLGLSVVKQFIEELNGEIYVDSELGKGSVFTCIFPLQESLLDDDFGLDEEMENLVRKSSATNLVSPFRPKEKSQQKQHAVLLVEDNSIAQSVAKSILERFHCEADIAENGKKAMELWQTKDYDLIFMDIGLPDLDGYELTHLIRKQELSKKTHVPIIALTAHTGNENKKRCINAGMNAVLIKPLTVKICAEIIDTFLPEQCSLESIAEPGYNADLLLPNDHLFYLSPFPLLDPDKGIKTMGSKTMLVDMLKLLLTETLVDDLAQMKTAHDKGDWEETQQMAHKIKSGAIYVGALRMKMACQYLERYWKTGQSAWLERLYQQTLSVIEDSIKEISKFLQTVT